ncbi:hypothetical protein D3C78_1814490 [compost metagenome]
MSAAPGVRRAATGLIQGIHTLPQLGRYLASLCVDRFHIERELAILIDHAALHHHAVDAASPHAEGQVSANILRRQRRG